MTASMWRVNLLLSALLALLVHSFPCPTMAMAAPLSSAKEEDGAAALLPDPLLEEMLMGADPFSFDGRRPSDCDLGGGALPPRFVKRNFNPWGGKRAGEQVPRILDYFKRGTFNAWGGKRQEGGRSTKSDNTGTRNLPFNPWGGR